MRSRSRGRSPSGSSWASGPARTPSGWCAQRPAWPRACRRNWTAVYVETPRLQRLSEPERDRILRNLRLAEELGATSITLGGSDPAAELVAYARASNATRLVIGREKRAGWRAALRLSAADRIVAAASEFEVVVVGADVEDVAAPGEGAARPQPRVPGREQRPPEDALAGLRVGRGSRSPSPPASRALTDPFFELANQAMIYLLAVTLVAVWRGRGPSVLASMLAVVSFDFFFVPPRFSFAMSDTQFVVTFAVMLAVGLIISNLAANIRSRARVAGYREQRTAALYEMSRELARADDLAEMLRTAVGHVGRVFEAQAVILLPDADGRIGHPASPSTNASLHGADLSVAQWVFDRGEPAGLGTETLPAAQAHYLPLTGSQGRIGVLALQPSSLRRLFIPEQQRLLETFASQIALALERARLGAAAHASELATESERLRNALLASISHDLRTPLASIVGASSSLLERGAQVAEADRLELLRAINEEAQRMTGLIDNVLDMARIQAGAASLNLQWQALEELIGATLKRLERRLAGHRVAVHVPERPPARARGRRADRAGAREPARQRRQVRAAGHADLDLGGGRRGPGARLGRGRGAGAATRRGEARLREIPPRGARGRAERRRPRLVDRQGDPAGAWRHDRGREPARGRGGVPVQPAASGAPAGARVDRGGE